MKSTSILTCSALLGSCMLLAGAASATQWSAQERAEYEKRKAMAESGQLLHKDKPQAKEFAKAQRLGVRADGVYWRSESEPGEDAPENTSTNYIRFCKDGSVVGVVFEGGYKKPRKVPSCNPVDPRYTHGVFKISKGMIKFRMHTYTGTIDYVGKVLPGAEQGIEFAITTNIRIADRFGHTDVEAYRFSPD